MALALKQNLFAASRSDFTYLIIQSQRNFAAAAAGAYITATKASTGTPPWLVPFTVPSSNFYLEVTRASHSTGAHDCWLVRGRRLRRLTGPAPTCAERHRGNAASAPRRSTPPSPPPTTTGCPGRRRAARPAMPSSYLAASPSSSASSPLSYMIPASAPPPPPPLLMGQGYSANGVLGGVPTSAGIAMSAAAVAPAPPRPGSRHAGPGHPPLPRPPPRQCPRCGSGNTKFCYYNNYSRTQPRYLCKACRRHWTEGGTLRDVPVGGGRKNRRGAKGTSGAGSARASASASATAAPASQGGGADTFPDTLRQVLFQPAAAGGGGGYSIDLSAWQQMAAAGTAPQGAAGDVGADGGAAEANCGALQFWSGWQQDDMPGLDGAC
ncbi:hypothetical protein ACP70R_021059 [Stipagrostis hirtigluma subsp. patula]